MKKDSLPDSFQKRKLLNDEKMPPERLISYGEMFFEAGHLYDAAEFFIKASHEEGIDRLRNLAVEQGDSFLYERLLRGRVAEQENTSSWNELGNRAMALKKFSHAIRAYEKAGNDTSGKEAQEAFKSIRKEVFPFD